MIKDFDAYNEEFLGIDLKKIKQAAYDFHKTKECRKLFSGLDNTLLDSVVNEYHKLKERWGSFDVLSKKILAKADSHNEEVMIGTIIFTVFGIHAFIKFLIALKRNKTFLDYLGSLFVSDDDLRYVRNLAISISFCFYLLVYIVSNIFWVDQDYFHTNNGDKVKIYVKWDGVKNYKYSDSYDKVYNLKKIGKHKYDIYIKDKKIGRFDNYTIYNIRDDVVFSDENIDSRQAEYTKFIKVDLEKSLTKSLNKETERIKKEITIKQKEMDKISHEIDSLNTKTYENVDQAKKILKDHEKNYDEIINGKQLDYTDRIFDNVRKKLLDKNNLGYLGLFTKFIYNDGIHDHTLLYELLDNINRNKDIINNLRDSNGNLKQVVDFDTYEELNDSLQRLRIWRKINLLMQKVPSTQKKLIWKDGWFLPELKEKTQFLTSCLYKIATNEDRSKTFLSKIAAIKTTDMFIESLSQQSKEDIWDFDNWLNKLNKTWNVYVTWSSKEENQIICIVTSYFAIKKIAYMTNWCIAREYYYFNSYSSKGLQCILYDFNYNQTNNNSIIGFTVNPNLNVKDCNDKSDRATKLPNKFMKEYANRYYNKGTVKDEYLKVNFVKAALKLDLLCVKALRHFLSRTINKSKYLSKFLDFYDD